jgi:hypothetical protein
MSKYSQKKKPILNRGPVSKKEPPVFDYTSACCSAPARKKACVIDKAVELKDRNKLEHSLGTWNCANCRKACKVTRSKHKAETDHVGLSAADTLELIEGVA